jgi:hypothetical protein
MPDLDSLPLFARALVAARMARRCVMAMLEETDREAALAACDLIERITRQEEGWEDGHPAMRAVSRIRSGRGKAAALEAVRWAFDSAGAAQGANDFPVDHVVGASAHRCFAAVTADPRVSAVQVVIVTASDVDQIAFACSEVHVGLYDPLTAHVFGRLAPCHALTLAEPRRNAAEEAR